MKTRIRSSCSFLIIIFSVLIENRLLHAQQESDPSRNRRAIRFFPSSANSYPINPARPKDPNAHNRDHTEKSIEKALNWLISRQDDEGFWQGTHSKVAHTGLASLSFLSYGVLPTDKTPFGISLRKGLKWLANQPDVNGDMRDGDKMYGQAIGTLALSEAYFLTKNKDLKGKVEKSVAFIAKAQNPESGGWRHQPYPSLTHSGDLSVTGWIYIALQSAKKSGINIPTSTLSKADDFISAVSSGKAKGLYGYTKPVPTASMTSVGMLCRILSDKPSTDRERESAAYLATHPPTPDQKLRGSGMHHYWFFATFAIILHGGESWTAWHDKLIPILVTNQESDGSWPPQGPRASKEGRVVTTAWSILSMTAVYKCIPILQRERPQGSTPLKTRKYTAGSTHRYKAARPSLRSTGRSSGRR